MGVVLIALYLKWPPCAEKLFPCAGLARILRNAGFLTLCLRQPSANPCACLREQSFFNFCSKNVKKTLTLKRSLKSLFEMSFKRLYLCYYYYYRLQAQAAQEIPQDPPLGIEAPHQYPST